MTDEVESVADVRGQHVAHAQARNAGQGAPDRGTVPIETNAFHRGAIVAEVGEQEHGVGYVQIGGRDIARQRVEFAGDLDLFRILNIELHFSLEHILSVQATYLGVFAGDCRRGRKHETPDQEQHGQANERLSHWGFLQILKWD